MLEELASEVKRSPETKGEASSDEYESKLSHLDVDFNGTPANNCGKYVAAGSNQLDLGVDQDEMSDLCKLESDLPSSNAALFSVKPSRMA